MSGAAPRQKGNRAERALVHFLQDHGFAAERVPLSGSAGGSYVGDLTVPLLGIDRTVEVKVRGNGFRELYAWLAGRDFLIVRADRREPLVVLPLKLATEIATAAERRRPTQPKQETTMTDFDNTNRGALFKNKRKTEAAHADYTGSININGREYWLDARIKKSKKDGKKFMAISVKPKTESADTKPTAAKRDDFVNF